MTQENEYPSWREALFGDKENGKVANAWCAVKYIFWHAAYVLLAVFGVALLAIVTVWHKVSDKLGGKVSPKAESAAVTTSNFLNRPYVKKAGRVLTTLLFIGLMLWSIGVIVYMLLMNPVAFIGALVLITGGILVMAIGATLIDEYAPVAARKVKAGGKKVGQKSKATPVARRVVGYCPVSMDMEPKWFDNLFNK